MEKLNKWNAQMNGLPRILWLVTLTLFATWLLLIAAPYVWPFILAFLLSRLLSPAVSFCVNRCKRIKLHRGLITLISMILLFGILGTAIFALASRLIRELIQLLQNTPQFVNWLTDTVMPYLRDLYQSYSDVLPDTVMSFFDDAVATLSKNAIEFAGTLSGIITGGALITAVGLPTALLSVVLTIMSTYYMTADKERITAFFAKTFPEPIRRHSGILKRNLVRSLFGQIKSQLLVSAIITSFLMIAFVVFGIRYGLLLGFFIGLADALPVVGAGLFLIPWAIVELVMGHYAMAAFFAVAYICVIIIRQIAEPRIVGRNLGLYPLATMIAMYVGFRLLGILGLIGGPVLLNLLRIVLEADKAARQSNAPPAANPEDTETPKKKPANGSKKR
ncbi:MAG TPA: sporulation integral membrane protein YtvI [Candidatus Limiplasma sp.]|nr:sporulation integral membrane protein YtvI [Candidatus Limiplasma sp.]